LTFTLHSLSLYSVPTLMTFLMAQVNFERTFFCINTSTILKPSYYSSYTPAYEDGTECSETSAYKIQTPGNYPEEKNIKIHHVTFQIPISTLSAVSSLLQSTRPIMQRPLFQLHTNNRVQTPAPVSAPAFAAQGVFFGRQTVGARVAKLTPAADGSSFKI
jgi:hypothetical protein